MIEVEIFTKAGFGKENEDYVLYSEIRHECFLVVICDGMGGLSHGAHASMIISNSIMRYVKWNFDSLSPEILLRSAILYSNDELAKECLQLHAKMGASIGVALFIGDGCYYSWIGDVRIYLKHSYRVNLLTQDHLAIESNHSYLSRCLNGKEMRCLPIVTEMSLTLEDEIFIATDGYYLHHELGSTPEFPTDPEDDATIVCIKYN